MADYEQKDCEEGRPTSKVASASLMNSTGRWHRAQFILGGGGNRTGAIIAAPRPQPTSGGVMTLARPAVCGGLGVRERGEYGERERPAG